MPKINWLESTAHGSDNDILAKTLEKGFEQLVTSPTHVKGNILDLVLTNSPEHVKEVRTEGRLGRSDHEMLWVELEGEAERRQAQEVPNWRKADWAAIRNGLSRVNWDNELKDKNAEESWNHLRDTLQELQRVHIPKKSLKKDWPPWMCVELLRAIRRKRSLWKKARTAQDKEKYAQEEKKVQKAIRTAKRNFEKRIAYEDKNNRKPFYNYVKKKTKGRTAVGPLKQDRRVVTDDTEMAEVLNEFFSSVFTREDTSNVPDPEPMQKNTKLKIYG